MRNRKQLWLVGGGWLVALTIGSIALATYSGQPGARAGFSPGWPADTKVTRTKGLPSLVVFLHPQCPCSRATLVELERVWAVEHVPAQLDILFYQPESPSGEWVNTALWRQAAAIPGARVAPISITDLKSFGALVSGQVMLFDSAGALVFSGGITGARGYEGTNAGSRAIEVFLTSGKPEIKTFPVFGCALYALEPEFTQSKPASPPSVSP